MSNSLVVDGFLVLVGLLLSLLVAAFFRWQAAERRRWESWETFSPVEAAELVEAAQQAIVDTLSHYGAKRLNQKLMRVAGCWALNLCGPGMQVVIYPHVPRRDDPQEEASWNNGVYVALTGRPNQPVIKLDLRRPWNEQAEGAQLLQVLRPCDLVQITEQWLFEGIFADELLAANADPLLAGNPMS